MAHKVGWVCVYTQNLSSAPIWMCRVKYLYQQPGFISLFFISLFFIFFSPHHSLLLLNWGLLGEFHVPKASSYAGTCCKVQIFCHWGFSCYLKGESGCIFQLWTSETWLVSLGLGSGWDFLPKSRSNTNLLVCFMLSKDLFQGNLGELWCCLLRLCFKALHRNIWKRLGGLWIRG